MLLKNFTTITILVILTYNNILRFFDILAIFPLTQRTVIISNKYGIYELSHELPNNLRLF